MCIRDRVAAAFDVAALDLEYSNRDKDASYDDASATHIVLSGATAVSYTHLDVYKRQVFNEHTMQERLPSATYKSLLKTMKQGEPLEIEVANVVAHAMKEWAIEKGATHFTHWFQPLSGITSEKHDSFLDPVSDGRAIMSFSGKELISGESDAVSYTHLDVYKRQR